MRGHVQTEERKFNPITQRFKDPQLETNLKRTEKEILVEHSNRARDIQNLREQPYDIVHNGSKLVGLEAIKHRGLNVATAINQDPVCKSVFPDSCQGRVDYNIISNHSYAEHHW